MANPVFRWTLAAALAASFAPVNAQLAPGQQLDPEVAIYIRGQARPVITPANPDVFGTAAINAGVTLYDARFRRVASSDRDHPMIRTMANALRGLSPEAQLARVQALVLSKVRWASDLDTMRVSDLWANAGETLERGAGDSEDIAIVQMQVLKAAGFDPRSLYISVGRRAKVGQHVVLLARTISGFYMLDDRLGQLANARDASYFTPIFTLTEGRSFVHGRRVAMSNRRAAE